MASTYDFSFGVDLSEDLPATKSALPSSVVLPFPRLPSASPAPLEKVLRIARDIGARNDSRHQAALFESLRPRLHHEIGAAANAAELETLRAFVELFYQLDFLVQTRYFDQLESLLRLLGQRSVRLGVAGFDPCAAVALESRDLLRLPLPVQRHIARKGLRKEIFACHEHNLIAREVVPHVRVEDLEQFLAFEELNRHFFEDALRGLDLRQNRGVIRAVLCHNRCPSFFVGRYLASCEIHELHQIIQTGSTHSEVRRRAMLLSIERRNTTNF
jgi:hypothetical protein